MAQMLQAQIEIVDEAGHTEESVTILGSGWVSLGMRETGGYLHADEAAPDLAVIAQDGTRVSIQVKVPNALQHDDAFLRRDPSTSRQGTARISRLAKRYAAVT